MRWKVFKFLFPQAAALLHQWANETIEGWGNNGWGNSTSKYRGMRDLAMQVIRAIQGES